MNILMPQLGETVSEGKILRWFKSVGDAVTVGENLCEIETDKVTVEVPATEAGILSAIKVEEGTVAPVGMVIAVVGEEGPAEAAGATSIAPPPPPPPPEPIKSTDSIQPTTARHLDPYREVQTPQGNFGAARLGNGATATPLARRLAATGGVDIASITGTGPRGRITGKDVEAALAKRGTAAPALDRAENFSELIGDVHRSRPHEVVPVDGMRRTIARRLGESKSTVPHFYLSIDVDLDLLGKMRAEANAGAPKDAEGKPAYKLSINDFLIKALGLALQEVPHANAIWSGSEVLSFAHSDIGVAVAVEGGLFTPVLHAVEQMPLSVISQQVKSLAARARTRSLQPHEYQGGTSSISNLGMYGVREFSAIINPPQSSILAVGGSHRHAVETPDGGVAFVDQLTATLSCDHRVIDGVTGAEVLASFKALVENPLRMLI
ncbi:MAG: 2-oxo acid dehydrogenase subunit E2 [Bauldia sp.]|nr:2-oxo acid dehydrogenase subunit E2 [Bauldia sp.]